MANQQRLICFSGMVQGVGFRFSACRIAINYDIAGYVRNLPDGAVECVVEGDEAEIDAFAEALSVEMGSYIRRQTSENAPYTGKLGTFTVRY